MSFQDDTNSLVFWTSGFVARSLRIVADMRLARALPEVQNPARLSVILKAHWNQADWTNAGAVDISPGAGRRKRASQMPASTHAKEIKPATG